MNKTSMAVFQPNEKDARTMMLAVASAYGEGTVAHGFILGLLDGSNSEKELLEIPTVPVSLAGQKMLARPHDTYDFLISSKEVAEGYGVTEAVIRKHKSRHSEELVEGRHFSSVTNSHARRTPESTGKIRNLESKTTLWTKAGIVRLGFFIRSQKARAFRDAAEALILGHLSSQETKGLSASTEARLSGIEEKLDRLGALLTDGIAENTTTGVSLKAAALRVLRHIPATHYLKKKADFRGSVVLVPSDFFRLQMAAILGAAMTSAQEKELIEQGIRIQSLEGNRAWQERMPSKKRSVTCWAFPERLLNGDVSDLVQQDAGNSVAN